MKLPGEENQKPMGISLIYMIIGVSAFILVMLLAVMKNNKKDNRGSEYMQNALQQQQQQQDVVTPEDPEDQPKAKLRAEDLDFWDMYPVDEDEKDAQNQVSGTQGKTTETAKENVSAQNKEKEIMEEDPSTDGKHTLIRLADGTEEWVLISPYLKKNTYDFSNMTESSNLRKYTENGKKISSVGADISKHNGSVNFKSMKSAGVDYVMLRLGARGYSTGQITLDDKFVENIEAAIEAELNIGVYFFSQAVNQEEAVEEANFVIQNLEPYKAHIGYPIAFDMENISNDNARIDGLSREDKTTIAASFMSGVQAAGYIPMIYGNKEWLIKNVDLTKLQDYDVWLSEDQDIPDYPYLYTMWQYTSTGVLNGVKGDVGLNLCFVNYSDR